MPTTISLSSPLSGACHEWSPHIGRRWHSRTPEPGRSTP
jgi:hypothetical protein